MPHNTSFNCPPSGPNVVISGAMSFDRSMHGAHNRSNSSTTSFFNDDPSFMDMSEATAMKIAALQAKLNQKLGPEYISTRPGPGGGPKLIYAEGWKVINLANEVFGFNGWSSSITSLTTDFIDTNEETKRVNVGVTAIVRVTLRDGVFHEDVGYGMVENQKSKGAALDKCRKEAVTDGLKRSLRNFGNLLGNCLYDKNYTQEVVKIKVNPPKFDAEQLHRRPEFSDKKPTVQSTSGPSTSSAASSSTSRAPAPPPNVDRNASSSSNATAVKTEPVGHHNLYNAASTSKTPAPPAKPNHTTPSTGSSARPTGLNTPITTPAHQSTHHLRQAAHQNETRNGNSDRRVAFAAAEESPLAAKHPPPPPAPEPVAVNAASSETLADDDSFAFGSEDDALYAMVDLGDCDAGRPIVQDEGEGGGYESESFNETSGVSYIPEAPAPAPATTAATRVPEREHRQGSMGPPPPPPAAAHTNNSKAKESRFAAIGAALAGLSAESNRSSGSGSNQQGQQQSRHQTPQPREQQQQPPPRVPLQQQPYAGNRSTSNPPQANNPRSRSNSNSGAPANQVGGMNTPPPPSFAGLAASTPKRGGFSFPPEIVSSSGDCAIRFVCLKFTFADQSNPTASTVWVEFWDRGEEECGHDVGF
ncbi:DNA repair protein rad52 [Marasmius sp. AFHP31]|nr:DNA repair protein rad52 [Marasmius sp. AFHP31]